jgi:hypothetical protein
MEESTLQGRPSRLLAALQRIARFEGRLLRDTADLQRFVDELFDRDVIVREGTKFRIDWAVLDLQQS